MNPLKLEGFTRKIGIKPFIIVIMVLLFLIPVNMIDSLIDDRSFYFKEAADSILQPKGGEPTIEGLAIAVPYTVVTEKKDAQGITVYDKLTYYIVSVPETLMLNTDVQPEYLSRGIFEVPVFNCTINAHGSFSPVEYKQYNIDEGVIQWNNALLLLGVSNKKNFTQTPLLTIGNSPLSLSLLSPYESSPFSNTVFYDVPSDFARKGFSYSMSMAVQGGNALHITPLASNNSFSVTSSWATPGFSGGWLPQERTITDSGFSARWDIAGLSTSYPKTWLSYRTGGELSSPEQVDISFLTPVDNYQKAERSVKYALLFLIIPFLAIFIFEVFTKIQIHPVQYCLIGLADVIFYLLLLSVSEHLSFVVTYWIASGAVSILLLFYASAIFKKLKWGGFFALVQFVSYIFLFGTLQAEDYALLIGSLGLFFVVVLLMVLTRKIDWYGNLHEKEKNKL
ncbi:MAG TPA: cell envelope integrity protein CreD [Treponemataceae bacterium]|nr:cell envelope integrity protein CreD [Treponemataceae bacterium]